MSEVAQAGRTVLFVSHQMAAVENLCQRVIYLQEGRIAADGLPKTIISAYLRNIRQMVEEAPLASQTERRGTGKVRLTAFHVETPEGYHTRSVQPGDDFIIVLSYEADENVSRVNVGVSLTDGLERLITVHFVNHVRDYFGPIPVKGEFRCLVRGIPLISGDYRVGAMVYADGEIADWPTDGVGYLNLQEGDFFGTGRRPYQQSIMMLDADWELTSVESIAHSFAPVNNESLEVLDG
jgi:lipopolysaccharide transport system ATP-binding protein